MYSIPYYKKVSIKLKLILLYFFTIIIPLLIIGTILLDILGNQIIIQTTQVTKESILQINSNTHDLLLQYVDVINGFSFDTKLQEYLDPQNRYEDIVSVMKAYEDYLNPVMNYEFRLKLMKARLKIYYQNETLLQNYNPYIYADEDVKTSKVYMAAQKADGKAVWGVENGYIYLTRMVKELNTRKDLYVISLLIEEDRLYSLINKSNANEKIIMICDENGMVITSNDRKLVGNSVKDKEYYKMALSNKLDIQDFKGGIDYKLLYKPFSESNNMPEWKIIALIPVDSLLKDERRIKSVGFIICTISLLISIVIFVTFLKRITRRLNLLVKKIKGIYEGNFSVIEDEGNYDEIGTVIRNFNFMVQSLQKLIYENYENNLRMKDITIKKREAEIYALQSQINPHFLFNMLESIRMNLLEKRDTENSRLLMCLSKMLRKSLTWHGEIIRLHEEIDFVENYLHILKYRFTDKLKYTVNVPAELLEYKIPKLIIQPLVENSMKHGIEPKWGQGFIYIEAYVEGKSLMIHVKDDGIGIDDEKLNNIKIDLSSCEDVKKANSIGIKNINDRIILHYGKGYGIFIDSRKGTGTDVVIKVPVQN